MSDTKIPLSRGRPRRFDPDEAVRTAQRLFHSKGYDGVSVADLTQALGIKPPSFYAAFGSKAGLYARVLDAYNECNSIPFAQLLQPTKSVSEGLKELLRSAAQHYSAEPEAGGCLVLEGARSIDQEAKDAACAFRAAAEKLIFDYIAAQYPEHAERLTDYVSTVMAGLSAMAHRGQERDRLLETARIAGQAIAADLGAGKQCEIKDKQQ